MSAASLTGLLASISGVVMALSPLLQARRVRAIRDSSEVSQAFVCVLIGNACVWILHGVMTAQAVLVVPNAVTVLAAGWTLAIVRRYRGDGHAAGAATAEPAVKPHHPHAPARVRAGVTARARRAAALARR